jgi:hypothetical protein
MQAQAVGIAHSMVDDLTRPVSDEYRALTKQIDLGLGVPLCTSAGVAKLLAANVSRSNGRVKALMRGLVSGDIGRNTDRINAWLAAGSAHAQSRRGYSS